MIPAVAVVFFLGSGPGAAQMLVAPREIPAVIAAPSTVLPPSALILESGARAPAAMLAPAASGPSLPAAPAARLAPTAAAPAAAVPAAPVQSVEISRIVGRTRGKVWGEKVERISGATFEEVLAAHRSAAFTGDGGFGGDRVETDTPVGEQNDGRVMRAGRMRPVGAPAAMGSDLVGRFEAPGVVVINSTGRLINGTTRISVEERRPPDGGAPVVVVRDHSEFEARYGARSLWEVPFDVGVSWARSVPFVGGTLAGLLDDFIVRKHMDVISPGDALAAIVNRRRAEAATLTSR
jgi:hypothetical protein